MRLAALATSAAGVACVALAAPLAFSWGGVRPATPGFADVEAAESLTVPATANIFGAGQAAPTAPAGGGAGTAPVAYSLPENATMVAFESAAGSVTCCKTQTNPPTNGPDGAAGSTDIEPVGAISGVTVPDKQMFLVGVFLSAGAPSGSPPPADTLTLVPRLQQIFYIGAGPRQVAVPDGATRLFVGFADAYAFHGQAGYYADNGGSVLVTFSVTAREIPPAPPPLHFSVHVKGEPTAGARTLFPSYVRTRIAGSGSFVLDDADRTRVSAAAGTVVVIHEYAALPDDKVTLAVTGGSLYGSSPQGAVIVLKVRVTASNTSVCRVGRNGQLALGDATRPRPDGASLGLCGDSLAYFDRFAGKRRIKVGKKMYAIPEGSVVKVSVSRPPSTS